MNQQNTVRNIARETNAANMARWLGVVYDRISFLPPFQNRNKIHLTTSLLFHSCMSILIDIERHIDFHPIYKLAKHKYAAFTFKWISRIQPVSLINKHSLQITPEELSANARFAMIASLSFLNIDIDRLLTSEIWRDIVYSSMYRIIVPETWGLLFNLLEKQFEPIP